MSSIDLRTEIREFLSTRRARITPEQSGLPVYGGNRRVKGLRREEVAMLAGVSVDYYVRMERGNYPVLPTAFWIPSPAPCNSTTPNATTSSPSPANRE